MGVSSSSFPRARSVPVGVSADPNESPVFINSIRIKENGGFPISTFRCQPDSRTTTALLDRCAVMYEEWDAFGEREVLPDGSSGRYKWVKFPVFRQKCLDFAAGLESLGVAKGDTVGIFSHNCMAWQIAQFGCHYLGAIPVPVYDALGDGAARFIIEHSECKVVVVHAQKLDVAKRLAGEFELLQLVVISNFATEGTVLMDEVIARGRENKSFVRYEPSAQDIAMIMYTSGTMGTPKGCVLTHENIIAGAAGLGSARTGLGTGDTFFSYLPLAHAYDLCAEFTMLAQGVRIGFFSGGARDIMSDIMELQPTILCAVPRVLNRIVEQIKKEIEEASPLVRMLINWAIGLKCEAINAGDAHSLFADAVILSKFRDALGGRIRIIVSGGAPLLPRHYELLRAVITPNIIQGYGATEFSSAGCVQEVGATNPMTVGPVSIVADMKFRRVEGMDYNPQANPPSGELMFRGPLVFQGYYKDEQATDEVFFDGWFASGDVGCLTSDGEVQIIDRVKQFVKLSHGEYISLSKLSHIYSSTAGVRSVFVFADSHHSQPVAVVVPSDSMIDDWRGRGIVNFANSECAKSEILKNLKERWEAAGLRGFERILDILIEPVSFTQENGLLTASQKLQLQSLRMKYEARLLELYNSHDQ